MMINFSSFVSHYSVRTLYEKIESHQPHDKPRQCIKKQRHNFADKGPSSQSYGFSSSDVWM